MSKAVKSDGVYETAFNEFVNSNFDNLDRKGIDEVLDAMTKKLPSGNTKLDQCTLPTLALFVHKYRVRFEDSSIAEFYLGIKLKQTHVETRYNKFGKLNAPAIVDPSRELENNAIATLLS